MNRSAATEDLALGASPPRVSDREQRLAGALEAYARDLERGATASLDEVLSAHADLADELVPLLEGVRAIHEAVVQDTAARVPAPPREAPRSASGAAIAGGPPTEDLPSGPAPARGEVAPRSLGDYTLVRELGRGGMGVVYEAVEGSLRRRVAVKVLPFAAVLDQRQITRFRNEAQAAAQLHHPHIVPVFAIGQERGVHYYAMQLIEGQSLAQAISELRSGGGPQRFARPTDTTVVEAPAAPAGSLRCPSRGAEFVRAAARLAADAADALQHAHDYGVVHRDVKPSNLLLDRQGKVWVTDFGLARMQSDVGVTRTGDVVGTLRYMSPEQALGRADRVDGRTDVYALGATLYELLTLSPAMPGETRDELLEALRRAEPTRPRRLNPAVPADLETIVLRAMEKDAESRYASARDLADDLRRYLDGLPTVARPPSAPERVGRFLRRHRGLVAAALACLTAVSAASTLGVALVYREQQRTAQALAETRVQQRRAERLYERARGLVDLFSGKLADEVAALPGSEGVRRRILAETMRHYEAFLAEAEGDATLAATAAATRIKAAAAAERLGRADEAIALYHAAETELRRVLARAPGDSAAGAWLARAADNRGRLLAATGEASAARLALDEAVAIRRRLREEDRSSVPRRAELAESLVGRSQVAEPALESAAATRWLREAASLLESARRAAPNEPLYTRRLAVTRDRLAAALGPAAPAEALAESDAALALLAELCAASHDDDACRGDLAMAANNRGALCASLGDWAAAADSYRRAVDELGRLVRRAPLAPRHRSELALAEGNLGMALARRGAEAASDEAFDRATETLARLADDFPADPRYARSLAAMWNNRGVALRDSGRLVEAAAALSRAVELEERRIADLGPASPTLLATHYANHAQVLASLGRFDDAARVQAKREKLEAIRSTMEKP